MPHRSNPFADALAAALQRRDLGEVERVLALYGGERVYVPRSILRQRDDGAADLARRLLAAGVGRPAAVAMVAARRGVSLRHARRLVQRAADTIWANDGRFRPHSADRGTTD